MSEAEGAEATAQPETTSWYPEEYKGVVETKGWKSPSDALKSYSELEKYVGQKSIDSIPVEINDEMASKLYAKLGRPESPDKYELKYEGEVELDENLIGDFKQFAHGLNLTGKQFNEVVNFQIGAITKAMQAEQEAQSAQLEQAAKSLKDEWKENYDTNFKQAKETAQKLEILDTLEELGLADNPKAIKLMHKLNSQLSEATLKPQPAAPAKDPKTELADLMKSEAFVDRMHPDHAQAMKDFYRLHGIERTS